MMWWEFKCPANLNDCSPGPRGSSLTVGQRSSLSCNGYGKFMVEREATSVATTKRTRNLYEGYIV